MKENTTEFGKVVAQALNTDLDRLVGKSKSGNDIRLMDMDENALNKAYKHAYNMLYNEDRYTPGKHIVKKNIKHLIAQCNAELFKRFLIYDCAIDTLKTPMSVVGLVRDYKMQQNLTDDDSIATLFDHMPQEFESVTFGDLLAACLDQLEIINRKMISQGFIISRGIGLTEDEKTELTELDELGNRRPWLDVMKERLFMDPEIKLRVDPRGFSYGEFRALIHLTPLQKISSLSTDTLKLMRDKVLPLLDADADWHIKKWERIMSNIEKVAKYKAITLVKPEI